jgi:hypothetical protein
MSSKKRKEKEKRHERRLSDKQRKANMENAQHSTGPTSPEGKKTSAQNAEKDRFFSKNPVAPWEDPYEYAAFKERMIAELAPEGEAEETLALRVAVESWRLRRVEMVEARIYWVYSDDFKTLSKELYKLTLNEMRVDRLRRIAKAELEDLQLCRRESEAEESPERRDPESVGAPMRAENPAQNEPVGAEPKSLLQGEYSPFQNDEMGSFCNTTPDPFTTLPSSVEDMRQTGSGSA